MLPPFARVAVLVAAFPSLTSCRPEPSTPAGSASEERAPWTGIDLSGKAQYSQSQEELIIRDFFQDRRKGFFVDVGCAWPGRANNTYYLEKNLGVKIKWRSATDYAGIIEGVKAKKIEIARFGPASYAKAWLVTSWLKSSTRYSATWSQRLVCSDMP